MISHIEKLSLFCAIFLSCHFSLLSQDVNYFIMYDFYWVEDTVELSSRRSDSYVLFRSMGRSYFMSDRKYYNDSISLTFMKEYGDPELLLKSSPNFDLSNWSQRFMDNINSIKKKTLTDMYVLRNDKSDENIVIAPHSINTNCMYEKVKLDWKITNEAMKIQGIDCTKAAVRYGGRDYLAWFAPSIPINDGPYVFNGLPGLILRVEDSQCWFRFDISSIDFSKSKRLFKNTIGNRCKVRLTRSQFIDRMNIQKNDPYFYFKFFADLDEEGQLRMKEEFSTRYDLLLEQNY